MTERSRQFLSAVERSSRSVAILAWLRNPSARVARGGRALARAVLARVLTRWVEGEGRGQQRAQFGQVNYGGIILPPWAAITYESDY